MHKLSSNFTRMLLRFLYMTIKEYMTVPMIDCRYNVGSIYFEFGEVKTNGKMKLIS